MLASRRRRNADNDAPIRIEWVSPETDTPKAGTRYERLASMVAKTLAETGAVVHDWNLTGDSDVPHQIDVVVEWDGASRRLLVECKDFDLSGNKVGLGIIRDFASVVDDIGPDAAFVVTCNGFTKDARKFAKHKGIVLVVMRGFKEEDWEGRLRQINVNMDVRVPDLQGVRLKFGTQERLDAYSQAAAANGVTSGGTSRNDPVTVGEQPHGRHLLDLISREGVQATLAEEPEAGETAVGVLEDVTLWVGTTGPLKVARIEVPVRYPENGQMHTDVITRLATLLLEPADGGELIIWDDELRRVRIDDDGNVVQDGEDDP